MHIKVTLAACCRNELSNSCFDLLDKLIKISTNQKPIKHKKIYSASINYFKLLIVYRSYCEVAQNKTNVHGKLI